MKNSLYILFFFVLLATTFIHAEYDRSNSVSPSRPLDRLSYRLVPPARNAPTIPSSAEDDFKVTDTIIIASVDGKLHALNRTTGLTLWSIGDDSDSQRSTTAFSSLVRTQHPPHENSDQELFIVEPQSGDIYVLPPMASPSEPLQRLPLSVPQLVELSPFTFQEDDHRVFVGSKQTTMLVIELDSGRLKGTVNSDKECFWDDDQVVENIDLDELDGTKPPRNKLRTREIHIGRTDYHIRVHLRHQGIVQNLHFSSYGPNNIDKAKQSQWKRTSDNLYVQPLSNGEILAFQVDSKEDTQNIHEDGVLLWVRNFREPIVAVFDILMTPSRPNPIALLQPRLRLEQIFPRRIASNNRDLYDFLERTHVGMVGASLYAMSHENFPLVAFDGEPPRSALVGDSEQSGSTCEGYQCLVGSRRSEPSQRYLPPLLDSVPHVQDRSRQIDSGSVGADVEINDSWTTVSRPTGEWRFYRETDLRIWGAFGGSLMLLMLLVRSFLGKMRAPPPVKPPQAESNNNKPLDNATQTGKPLADPSSSPLLQSSLPLSPTTITGNAETAHLEDSTVPPTHKIEPPSPPKQTLPVDAFGDHEEGEESEKEDALDTPKRKGPRRRKRGKKKKNDNQNPEVDTNDDEGQLLPVREAVPEEVPNLLTPNTPLAPRETTSSSLIVSDNILGFGSHGTVVYEGSLQGRAVAVKRLLRDFVTIATREVELLQESDDHPNVIRYFYKEFKDGFLYIALELCPASLADIVERPDAFSTISSTFDPKRALAQVTAGLRHLHQLKIVHRDIKPQNILVSRPKNGQHRMLISDFGLCKKLDVDQTSFLPTVHGTMAAGTVGWRAPEILRGEVKLDEQPMDPDDSSRGSTASAHSQTTGGQPTRLTKSVDVFALGCLVYYTLTGGSHPFGDRFERESNILKGKIDLDGLEQFGEEGVEAVHLISQMLNQEAKLRPDTTTCLIHPFFWTPARRLNFLQDSSDRFEIMCREPREAPLIALETGAYDVVGNDWHSRLDRIVIENLGKFRKYDGQSVQDLLRALRNKKHHYQDLPDNVKRHFGPLPEGFLGYFTRRFPGLILHVHEVTRRCGLAQESMFKSYFELDDS